MRRLRRAAAFGPLVSLVFVLLASSAGAVIQVPYVQFDRVHCFYDYAYQNNPGTPPDEPKVKELRFYKIAPGGMETLVRSVPVPDEGLARLQDTAVIETPDPGKWTFRIQMVLNDANGTRTTVNEADVEVTETFGGTLLVNEVLDNVPASGARCRGVGIPAGLTLDLDKNHILGTCSFGVTGELILDGATFEDSQINYHKVIALSNPPKANYAFTVSGSSILSGEDLTVSAGGAEVSLNAIKNLTLNLSRGPATFIVNDCDLVFGAAWDLLSGGIAATFTNCRIGNTSLLVRNGDNILFTGTGNTFGQLTVSMRGTTGRMRCEDGLFDDYLTINGDRASDVLFKSCEFAGPISIWDRVPARFEDNMFRDWVLMYAGNEWATSTAPGPVFENNDFLGQYCFYLMLEYSQEPASPIRIGPNFYGDAAGPEFLYWNGGFGASKEFLGRRGARFYGLYNRTQDQTKPGPLLTFDPPKAKGTWSTFRSRKNLPRVWLVESLVGQGSVAHGSYGSFLLAGTDFFVSLDIACNVPSLDGVRVFVELNGTEYESTRPRKKITRSLDDYTPRQIARAESTVNFFLPVPDPQITSLKVYLDTTGVSGFDEAGKQTLLTDLSMGMRNRVRNDVGRLGIIVQPIKLLLLGYITTPAPSGTGFVSDLDPYFKTMMPVRSTNVRMVPQPPLPFTGVVSNVPWIGTYTLTNSLATWLQATLSLANLANSAFGLQRIDFVIAVVPPGGLGAGIDGANMALRRSIILVDQQKHSATFHEMGHTIGLYGTEQYELFPPNGLPVEGCSIFKKEDAYTAMFFGDQGRLMHLPAPHYSWYVDMGFFDIMSAVDVGVWPIPSTWDAFFSAFRGRLATTGGKEAAKAIPLPTGMRALAVQGAVRLVPGTSHYEFVPGSLWSYPMTRVDQLQIPSLPLPGGPEDTYEFNGYDAGNQRLDHQAFRLLPTSGESEAQDLWWGTFVIANSSVVRTEIRRVADGAVVFEHRPAGPLTVSITAPASGQLLTGDVPLRWQTGHARKKFSKTDAPITHMVYLSSDNGATWSLLFPFVSDQEVTIPSDMIPATTQLALRVDATDGLQVATATVLNLRIANHPPQVTIVAPQAGDKADAGTAWTLHAVAWDVDDRASVEGSWSSSRDGALGAGNTRRGVVLSPGTHTLTFRASDSQSAEATASVAVEVGPPVNVDLALADDALTLTPPGSNPHVSQTQLAVRPGKEHAFRLQFRNQGFAGEAVLRLHALAPDGGETLLAEETLTLAPFEEVQLPALFSPTGPAPFRFRGSVEGITFPDPDTTNNTRTWEYQATLGMLWVVQ
jgi:hypothetical protein